jgi:hypothetical protein
MFRPTFGLQNSHEISIQRIKSKHFFGNPYDFYLPTWIFFCIALYFSKSSGESLKVIGYGRLESTNGVSHTTWAVYNQKHK